MRLATRREVARRRAPGCADEGVQGGQQEGRWRGMERGGLSVPGGAVFGAVATKTTCALVYNFRIITPHHKYIRAWGRTQ